MKKSIFSLLAVVTMAGCTQGDVVELVPNENVEIKLTSSAIAAETMKIFIFSLSTIRGVYHETDGFSLF